MYKIRFHAMGSEVEALIDSESEQARSLLEQVPAWFEEWEQHLSRFRWDSELSQLNRSQGEAVSVSPVLWDVLQVALEAAEDSRGLVTPAVLDALEAAGYDRSFELLENSAGMLGAHFSFINSAASLDDIAVDTDKHKVLLPEGLRLDFGGSAKGWAAHQAAQRLAEYAPALVSAGGDIALTPRSGPAQSWQIGIKDPFNLEAEIARISLREGGVATSGTDHRHWEQDGEWRTHIIDPRSNAPVESDVLSATVIAPNLMEAEMAAKTCLILGSEQGMQWLRQRSGNAGLFVLQNGIIALSNNMESYLVKEYERNILVEPI
ncbi:FAD:protein FMN transferase [Pelolinea submarina]|uniref:FAD:protein FMN transferase n=1 Tax=Pelolinea submarina TaxID=913107 RepID=A0A347ZPD4_9CHLR|nr:FAD:protein FMN transferase [Pelolinea submarina]REG08766.1 thiamine biosynthesis lipoprotein [Pelolinea submarina]BBB47165.1 FAD:protein FMN transferase [Pelolinea submarina]